MWSEMVIKPYEPYLKFTEMVQYFFSLQNASPESKFVYIYKDQLYHKS